MPYSRPSLARPSFSGRRLNPRKADLRRWREAFARELQSRGIEAVATSQAVRGASRAHAQRWRLSARTEGRERTRRPQQVDKAAARKTRLDALHSWARLHQALSASHVGEDGRLAEELGKWLSTSTDMRAVLEKGRELRMDEPGIRRD